MALQIWLPLNGNLEHKGIKNTAITNNGATVNSAGKIGECYRFNGSSNYLYTPYNFYNSTYSISAWIYSTSASATQTIICDRTAVGSGFSTFLIGGKLRIDAGGNNLQWTTNYTYPVNTWFHLAVTYDGTSVSYYIDGVFKETKVQAISSSYWGTTTSIGASQANGSGYGNYLNGYLNDIRIYDHCLSAKEVKELSQGLILHYKLNGCSGGTGENLLRGNYRVTTTSGGNSPSGSLALTIPTSELPGKTFTFTYDYSIEGDKLYVNTGDYTKDRYGIHLSYNYTNGSTTANAYPGANYLTVSGTGRAVQTFTIPSGITINSFSFGIQPFNKPAANNNNIWYLKNVKLEEGAVDTGWSLAPADLGMDITKITDSSGYEHNGSLLSAPTTINDADRYQFSTNFDGTDDGILIENLILSPIINDKATYSFWIKPNGENGARSVYFGSYSGASWSIEKTAGNLLRSYWNGSPDETCSGATITDGVWQHIAIVKNGTNDIKAYINGVQKWASTATHNTVTFPTTYRIGRDTRSGDGTPYKGQMSDFRIYATALSEGDILDLYHTSANIDNLGGIHGFEFIEDNGNSISQNGLVHTNEIKQHLELVYPEYDNALYFEPDGSAWVHIYHHNNPGAGSFASTDSFATGVYKDANRWFDATRVCNSLTQWEFLVKYAFTSGGTEYKQRWIQNINPELATYENVAAANITRITGNGYSSSTWGGLYKKNGSAYWVQNNGTNGNWWGATGPFSVYQSGSPSYGGTVTTTGHDDLYVRIDNLSWSNFDGASIVEDGTYQGTDFIEK